jgi:hypothetical protein
MENAKKGAGVVFAYISEYKHKDYPCSGPERGKRCVSSQLSTNVQKFIFY